MTLLKLKSNVKLSGLSTQVLLAIQVAHAIWAADKEPEMVVTSINDSRHSLKSKHWTGDAFDLRVRDPISGKWVSMVPSKIARLRECLTDDYDVVDETDGDGPHIHIEYDPKG